MDTHLCDNRDNRNDSGNHHDNDNDSNDIKHFHRFSFLLLILSVYCGHVPMMMMMRTIYTGKKISPNKCQ